MSTLSFIQADTSLHRISQFDSETNGFLISQFQAVIIPRGKLGIMSVTIGILVHISTVLTITLMFHLRTRVSFVGQSWHTVAQMQNEAVAPVLERGNLMRDDEVDNFLENEGIDGNERFFVGKMLVEDGEEGMGEGGQGDNVFRRRR